MRLHYNAPVVLTYTLIAMVVLAIDPLFNGAIIQSTMTVLPGGSFLDPMTWVRIFGHALGHAGWDHLLGNFAVILLIGPILEEKYGSGRLFLMITFTALFTGVIVTLFFREGLLGASGVAFMMILLGSFANAKFGKIPLTFILVAIIYLGREIFAAFSEDHISQMAHIIGGVTGSIFGFLLTPKSSGNNYDTKAGPKNLPPEKKPPPTANIGTLPDLKITPEQMRFGMDD
jgi:rhomboid protease GluP